VTMGERDVSRLYIDAVENLLDLDSLGERSWDVNRLVHTDDQIRLDHACCLAQVNTVSHFFCTPTANQIGRDKHVLDTVATVNTCLVSDIVRRAIRFETAAAVDDVVAVDVDVLHTVANQQAGTVDLTDGVVGDDAVLTAVNTIHSELASARQVVAAHRESGYGSQSDHVACRAILSTRHPRPSVTDQRVARNRYPELLRCFRLLCRDEMPALYVRAKTVHMIIDDSNV